MYWPIGDNAWVWRMMGGTMRHDSSLGHRAVPATGLQGVGQCVGRVISHTGTTWYRLLRRRLSMMEGTMWYPALTLSGYR